MPSLVTAPTAHWAHNIWINKSFIVPNIPFCHISKFSFPTFALSWWPSRRSTCMWREHSHTVVLLFTIFTILTVLTVLALTLIVVNVHILEIMEFAVDIVKLESICECRRCNSIFSLRRNDCSCICIPKCRQVIVLECICLWIFFAKTDGRYRM